MMENLPDCRVCGAPMVPRDHLGVRKFRRWQPAQRADIHMKCLGCGRDKRISGWIVETDRDDGTMHITVETPTFKDGVL